MSNFDRIKDSISKSSIVLGDQVDLLELFSNASDSDIGPVADLFEEDSKWVERISQNYKSKQAAKITSDSNLWKLIIEEEEKELKEIEKYNSVI